ncbi:bifunctional protein GlmU-like [Diadema antillarum]|uniref:bifunctional protein GlmU-like n=1 Tax=Diadema antillarum TaxID=105358 RepID=UPI003A8B9999
MESSLRCHCLRLRPGEELKSRLLQYVTAHGLKAAFILSCVGSLKRATLRLADSVTIIHVETNHEIVSLVGSLSAGGHLHVCLSDDKGKTVGGHLVSDAVVFTTAEIVIGELPQLEFDRSLDQETGYKELTIHERTEKT